MGAFVWWCMIKGSLGEIQIWHLTVGIGCLQLQDLSPAVKVDGAAFSGISANLYQTILVYAVIHLSSKTPLQ